MWGFLYNFLGSFLGREEWDYAVRLSRLDWPYVLSNVALWGACGGISFILIYLVFQGRRQPSFSGILAVFAVLTQVVGLIYLMDALEFLWPAYLENRIIRILAAGISWVALASLIITLPRLTRLVRGNQNAEQPEVKQLDDNLEQRFNERARIAEQALTEAKIAKEQLALANQSKAQFLSNISHEFRTPLNAVIGYAEMLESGLAGDLSRKQQAYAHNIAISGRHLLEMVDDIIDLSNIPSGDITLYRETVSVPLLLNELESLMRPKAEKQHITLTFDIASNLPEIKADPARLKQILKNLINNAIKFNQEGGDVTIRACHDTVEQSVIFEIRDTGIGIARDKQSYLFGSFYQVDGSFSRKHGGSGIGLALTKHLVELHEGTIHLESREGTGSTVTIRLPIHPSDYPECQSKHSGSCCTSLQARSE